MGGQIAAVSPCFTPPLANLALHLSALIPRCCGLPWYRAARVGAVWGLGHGLSATLVGLSFFAAKRGIRLLPGMPGEGGALAAFRRFGDVMELAIGFSLIVI